MKLIRFHKRGKRLSAMTAAEGLAELEKDPEYVRMVEDKWREHDAKVARNRIDSASLRAELAHAGFDIEWIGDLYRGGYDYRPAIPNLAQVAWAPRQHRRKRSNRQGVDRQMGAACRSQASGR
jgi:hypothetical protein